MESTEPVSQEFSKGQKTECIKYCEENGFKFFHIRHRYRKIFFV